MPINVESLRQKLKTFAIRELFIEDLGWDHHSTHPLEIQVNGKTHILRAIAEKRGMVAYLCHADQADLPDYPTRLKIERQTERTSHEHIIIFTDKSESTQIWQWVKREPGCPSACRQHQYHKDQPGDALIQKLEAILFRLDEEPNLTISHVTARARQAFDLDRVTKRFYDSFKSEHTAFLTFIKGLTAQADKEWYASLMLNRLMFIYFFQKKGFLDNDTDYLRNRLQQIRKHKGAGKFLSFYTHFLLRLFHEGLGDQERTTELDTLLGSVPYLDGGLFDIHELERNTKIEIADEAFEKLFDFFDKWQWHLDDRPLHADNEINPDVLGYIFEKYINQRQMGAYYTREDITGYISQNTILPFLLTKLQIESPDGFEKFFHLLDEDPDRYIFPELCTGTDKPLPAEIDNGLADQSQRIKWNQLAESPYALEGETWRECVGRRERLLEIHKQLRSGSVRSINHLITLNLNIRQFSHDIIETCNEPATLLKLYQILTSITVLDPTCGSGAFLFAALNILELLYEHCLDRMHTFLDDSAIRNGTEHADALKHFSEIIAQVHQHPNTRYFILKSIIINSLFGVDIMKEAVEICKLRLFLKLVAQLTPPEKVEPLPDIDFNIKSGNTLIGFSSRASIEQALQGRIDFESSVEQIMRAAKSTDEAYQLFTELQEGNLIDSKKMASAKTALRKLLLPLEDKLNRFTSDQYHFALSKDRERYESWLKTYQPFHWFIEFYGTMKHGGFDVIIGNPPYLETREVDYQPRGFDSADTGTIHAMCMERSCQILQPGGCISMIVPLSLVSTQRMAVVQRIIEDNRSVCYANFSWRPGKLFDTVNRALTIFVAFPSEAPKTFSTNYQKWNSDTRNLLMPLMRFAEVPRTRTVPWVPKLGDIIERSILQKFLTIPEYSTQGGR
jgi:hypothetical protein